MSDRDLERWLKGLLPMSDRWVVAWQGDEVVAGILGWVDELENVAKGRRRGYIERIFTRRPWRRRGIASALICQNLRDLRDIGMHEGAQAFDSDNPSGAGSTPRSVPPSRRVHGSSPHLLLRVSGTKHPEAPIDCLYQVMLN